jgi:murein DD-endopeptidase MepM/ murein hydrolase activator NlpD
MSTIRTIEFIDSHLHAMRLVFIGIFTVTGIFLLSLLLSTVHIDHTARTVSTESNTEQAASAGSDDPNVIAGGMATAGAAFAHSLTVTGVAISNSCLSIEISAVQSAKFVVRSGVSLGNGTRSVAVSTGRSAVDSMAFLIRIPGNILGLVPRVPTVSAVIKPADYTSVPVIDSASEATLTAQAKTPVVVAAGQPTPDPTPVPIAQADSEGSWPIHGAITTLFGVPELPYQAIHTGLDISDGKRPGVTPVKPFKPGRVLEATHSTLGLGNHIVIDHGGGLTSVYGHLYSMAVQPGQQVDKTTILGLEGTTGVSTGTHLHFEIRVNGQAMDPHKFISGQPY